MNGILQPTTRRTLLQRGLLFVAGALGAPLAMPDTRGERASPEPSPPSPPSSPISPAVASGGKTLRFYARRLMVHCPSPKAGALPAWSGRSHTAGDLLDGPNGSKVGEFSATCLGPESVFGCAGTEPAVELQTLKVTSGTLFGIGGAAPTAEGERAHAILGGTGCFAGARGSYVIRQNPGGQGEDGVEFLITLQS